MLIVEYVIDVEVVLHGPLIWAIAGHCPRKCETVSSLSLNK